MGVAVNYTFFVLLLEYCSGENGIISMVWLLTESSNSLIKQP